MKKPIETHFLKPEEYDGWSKFVNNSSTGSIYSTAEYLDILSSVTNANFRILVAKKGDEIIGGIGLYEKKSKNGIYVSSRLLLYYNGIVLKDYDTKYPSQATSRQLATLSALEEALTKLNYDSVRFRNLSSFNDARVFFLKGWKANLNYTYTVDITDIKSCWEKIDTNLQRLINRCEKMGFRIIKNENFNRFYELHLQTHERKGSPVYLPFEEYKKYYERLRSLNFCNLYHAATPEGKIVSSQLVLLGHPVTHTVCAAGDEDYLNTGVNAFLRWKVFEDLSKQGFLANDLTDAALNPVTRFKSQLGGDLQPLLEIVKTKKSQASLSKKVKRKLKQTIKKFIK